MSSAPLPTPLRSTRNSEKGLLGHKGGDLRLKWGSFLFCALLSLARVAWACEELLSSAPHLVRSSQLHYSEQGQASLVRLNFTAEEFGQFFDQNHYSPVFEEANHRFSLVVFKSDDKRMDRGYLVTGTHFDSRYEVDYIVRSDLGEEKAYFRKVAQMRGVPDRQMYIPNEVLDCNSVSVSGWVHTKIWLKHRVRLSEVKAILMAPELGPVDDHSHSFYDEPHYAVMGHDPLGRRIQIILAADGVGHCPLRLVTAFELRLDLPDLGLAGPVRRR